MATISSTRVITWSLQTALFCVWLGGFLRAESARGLPLSGTTESHLSQPYQNWLSQDVLWIITPEEKAAFISLSKAEEGERFIKQFWLRRDPTPATPENEYKEEHYRRLAYANTHFAAGIAGFATDRGRTYIVYGPPDEIKVQLGSDEVVKAVEVWYYKSISGHGSVDFRFVDRCNCGDYMLQAPPEN